MGPDGGNGQSQVGLFALTSVCVWTVNELF